MVAEAKKPVARSTNHGQLRRANRIIAGTNDGGQYAVVHFITHLNSKIMKQTRSYNKRKTESKTGTGRTASATGSARKIAEPDKEQHEDAVDQFNSYDDHQPSYLETFFISQLKDIYYAEHKILDGLKILQQAASTEELKDAFLEHGQQTSKHVKRLERIFSLVNQKPEGQKCEAIS